MKNQRFFALFGLGLLVFSHPIMSLFNHNGRVFGLPILYIYILVVWLFLIVGLWVVSEYTDDEE